MKPERIEELRVYAEKSVAHKYEDGCSPPCIVNPHDLLHLLRCARVVVDIETEALAGLHEISAAPCVDAMWEVQIVRNCEPLEWAKGPDLLTAIEVALAKAKETSRGQKR